MINNSEEIKEKIILRIKEEINNFKLGLPYLLISQIHKEFEDYYSVRTIQSIGKSCFPKEYAKIWSKPKITKDVYPMIKTRIAKEINDFNQKRSAASLAKIFLDFTDVVNSVDSISYIAKKEFPNEYAKIWARPTTSDIIKEEIEKRLEDEISKYENGKRPKSLSQIHIEFHEKVKSLDTVIKIAKEKFPQHYKNIWSKIKITPEIKDKVINRIREEIEIYRNGGKPLTIRDIWKEGFHRYMAEGQLGNIARGAYPEDYRIIWSAYRISPEVKKELRKAINNEISKYDSGKEPISIRQIQQKYSKCVKSKDHIISIAKNIAPEKYEEIWGIPRIPEQIKNKVFDVIKHEINKYKTGSKPRTIKEIWKEEFEQFIKTRDTVSNIARESFPKEYDLIWGKEIPTDKKVGIIRDILDYDNPNFKTMGQIAKKYGVSNTTIIRISVNEVEECYTNFSHEDRFPKDLFADIGTILHSIIKILITFDFYKKRLKIYSEIIVDYDTNVFVDNFLLNINPNNYLYKTLCNNKRLTDEMGLNIDELSEINAFMFDYTNDMSEENIKKKISKYQKKDKILFIIGTRWPRRYRKRVIETRYKNIRIINHDLFVELIGMDDKILKIFKYMIEQNYIFDLNGLKETFAYIKLKFHEKLGRNLFVNDDLRKDLRKMGIDYLDFFNS